MPIWSRKKIASCRSAEAKSADPVRHRDRSAKGIPRYLQGLSSSGEGLSIQREDEAGSSGPQLAPPSLLQPRDPYAGFRPSLGLQYQVNPALQPDLLQAQLGGLLDPARLLPVLQSSAAGVGPLAPTGTALPAGPEGRSGAGGTTTPAPTTADAGATSDAASKAAAPDKPTTRPGGAGDVLSAVTALPQVHRLLDTTRDQTLGQLKRYWGSADTGERVGFVSASVLVGGSFLAPLLALPGPRGAALPLLNGKVIPIPLVEGYGLEFNFGANSVTVGAHVDVGRLLPASWGFGPASLKPIGDPPQAQSGPVSRKAEAAGRGASPSSLVAAHIHAEQGRGAALPPAVRTELGGRLGADLRDVRIHDGASANALTRELHAQAFTVGADIFFRSGRYAPASAAGARLLAHEVVHTQQQARGKVSGTSLGPGLRVSDPQDAHEREADAIAEHGAQRDMAFTSAGPGIQRQPEGAAPTQAKPPTAAQVKAAAPPLWTDYFDEVVPAVLEAAEGNDKVGLKRALWLIIQAYGEQSPGVVGPPSGHRNRLFNEQGAVTREGDKITGVEPGQESEGVYLYNLPQNEAAEKGKTDMKTSPTFGYDSPERASTHHLEQMQKRWTPAWDELTKEKGSFDEFAHGLKRSGYAKADTYDTDLIDIQGQVRGQVVAWIKYRTPEMRARVPRMKSYLALVRDTRDSWAKRVIDNDPLGENAREYDRLEAMVKATEAELADLQERLARLERFAGVMGVKLPAAEAAP